MFGLRPRADDTPPPEAKSAVLQDLIALHGQGPARWSSRDPQSLARTGFARNPVAYRCIETIASAAASVPLLPCREGHPSDEGFAILDRPNPTQSGKDFLEAIYGALLVAGNAYLEVVAGVDGPAALYVLPPGQVRAERSADGWPVTYIHSCGTKKRRLPARAGGDAHVLHLALYNPLDPTDGQSPLAVAADAIDVHHAATAWNKALLDNAARPSGALVYRGPEGAGNLTGAQFDRLKEELAEAYGGARRAGRPMVLDGGLDWKPMGLSPAEMDFRELRHGAARDIALAFGVPPMLLGIPGDNTYANYAQANIALWRQTVLPLAEKVAAGLSGLMGEESCHLVPNTERIEALAPVRAERLKVLLETDVLSRGEKRAALGYPPEEGGEERRGKTQEGADR